MSDQGLRITDVIKSIRKHKTVIIFMSVAAAVAGAVFHIAGPKKYEAKTEFVVRNPMYADRNFIYNADTKLIDYFANEDDIDRVMLMSEADIVQGKVIANMNLGQAYGIDVSNRKGAEQLSRKFSKSYNITRTEYKSLLLAYTDVDADRAAAVANECVSVLENAYNEYYKEMRKGMYTSLLDKISEEDSVVNVLTDSLVKIREEYGVYDIVNPARYNLMMSGVKEGTHKNYARGLEIVQNIESLKDELVTTRARQTTLVNQYKTGNKIDQLPLLKVVTVAKPPVSPKGIGGMYMVLACAFVGFFFSTIFMVFMDSLKEQGL